jgi:hypothetical protein
MNSRASPDTLVEKSNIRAMPEIEPWQPSPNQSLQTELSQLILIFNFCNFNIVI